MIVRFLEVKETSSPLVLPNLSFSFFFIFVREASQLWRAKSLVGSSYRVLDVNIYISI